MKELKKITYKEPTWSEEFLFQLKDWFYHTPLSFLRNLKASWDFARVGWKNYDWDGDYLIKLMQFKLKRIKIALENGVAEPNQNNELKALILCIKLGSMLENPESISEKIFKNHDDKWGTPVIHVEQLSCGNYGITSKRNASTEEEKKQERESFRIAYKRGVRRENKIRSLYFAILAKYLPYMWD